MASVIANCLYVLEFARETPTKRLLLNRRAASFIEYRVFKRSRRMFLLTYKVMGENCEYSNETFRELVEVVTSHSFPMVISHQCSDLLEFVT
jgi:hypothetical protein